MVNMGSSLNKTLILEETSNETPVEKIRRKIVAIEF